MIPKIPSLYDEPFADPSQIPTFLVSQLARSKVTVSLSGDGGDELFAGYGWYFRARRIWHQAGWIPPRGRKIAASLITGISPAGWDKMIGGIRPVLPRRFRRDATGDKAHKLAELVRRADSPEDVYRQLVSKWNNSQPIVSGLSETPARVECGEAWEAPIDIIHRLMYLDTNSYLPDNILAKVDRASMGVSLESRAPLLDHRVYEFAWRIPSSMKVRNGRGKWLLRQVLYRYIPQELVERPKMGFCVPIDSWLRGPLREWAEALLDERRSRREGFLDAVPIRRKWSEHLSSERNWQRHLWNVLMFQAWLAASESRHSDGRNSMRILVVTNLYPNPLEPERAPFNRYQVRALAAQHPVQIISPIAWTGELAVRSRGRIPHHRRVICDGIVVDHPRYWYTPKVMRNCYGHFFSRSIRRTFARALREFQPDLVLASWAYPDGWAAVELGHRVGLPVVIKVHGCDILVGGDGLDTASGPPTKNSRGTAESRRCHCSKPGLVRESC